MGKRIRGYLASSQPWWKAWDPRSGFIGGVLASIPLWFILYIIFRFFLIKDWLGSSWPKVEVQRPRLIPSAVNLGFGFS